VSAQVCRVQRNQEEALTTGKEWKKQLSRRDKDDVT